MKAFRTALLLGAFLTAPVAFADSMSINQFTPRVLPVLVQVDSHGQVREVSPSVALAPQYDRMLRQTLDQMLALYAWHGAHHTGHITSLRERNGW